MVDVYVIGGEITEEEKKYYLDHAQSQYPRRTLTRLDITLDGDFADLHYYFKPVTFERVRRITGYLVGTLDRWNDAKKAEEKDRVKHQVH